MSLSSEYLNYLLNKLKDKTITRQELRLLQAYMHDVTSENSLDQVDFTYMPVDADALPETAEKRWQHILHALEIPPRRRLRTRYWTAAASILLVITGTYFILPSNKKEKKAVAVAGPSSLRTITAAPSDKIVLELSDGRRIDLEQIATDTIVEDGGTQIRLVNNQLMYESNGPGSVQVNNTILTPKGKQLQLVLPDGSRVWLNTASQLIYPVRFTGNTREVTIEGEAYFEIKKDRQKPFFVKTNKQLVEVLGTHFNVSAYPDDMETETTLVEGSVKVSLSELTTLHKSEDEKILRPGQQAASATDGGGLIVKEVDAAEVVSWKDNLFVFHNEEIKEVMKKISRWYDVEIEYRDGMEGKKIGGSIPRFSNLTDLMESLKSTGLLNYQQEGGTVTIMK